MGKALLFDVGDVLMKSTWDMLDVVARITGRTVTGRGPFDPGGDPDWQRYLAGQIPASEYWEAKAVGAGYAGRFDMWRDICLRLGDEQFDPRALELVREARAAGVLVGILSNDLVAIGGREWVDTRPELAGYDAFVDATEFGERKPAPRPYLAAVEQLGVDPGDVVFLDDTAVCVDGARAVGMVGVHVDPTDPGVAYDRARRLVGLRPLTPAEAMVADIEAAYNARDLERVMALFHPEAVVHLNGVRAATGIGEIRRLHEEKLGFDDVGRPQYRVHKTLRAATDDTLAVEWWSTYLGPDGAPVHTRAGEFFVVRYGKVLEWHGYPHRLDA
jgi:putative hydrolase of the HAD superfamily